MQNRNQIQFYVLGQRIDVFDGESIVFSLRKQDLKDIKNVLTDFTHPIEVPASPNNNKVFKHILKTGETDLDPRSYHEALIKINNKTFRRGYVQFVGGLAKSARLNKYKLRFFGGLATLPQRFADDKLRDLDGHLPELRFQNNESFSDLWLGLLKNDTDPNFRICLNSFDKGYLYDSSYTAENAELEDYLNIWHSDDNEVNMRDDFGVPLIDLKPSIFDDLILRAIEARYGIKFSRGEDINGLPTADSSKVVKNHYFNTLAWKKQMTLLHNKSVDEEALRSRPEEVIFWDNPWGNVTAPGSVTSGVERFFSGVTKGIAIGAAAAATGGLGAALLGPAGFSAGLASIVATATTAGLAGSLAGLTLGASWGEGVDPAAMGDQRSFLVQYDSSDEGDLLASRYWVDAEINKSGSGFYEVSIQNENKEVIWSTGSQNQTYRSSSQDDYIELEFERFSGGTGPETSAGEVLTFPEDGPEVLTVYVRKSEGVTIDITKFDITSEVQTNTPGVWPFRDFEKSTKITGNTYTSIPDSAEFNIADALPNIKVMDWLDGHWKKDDLTAEVALDANGDLIVATREIEKAYEDGNVLDLTKTFNSQDYGILIPQFYSPIIFKYSEPSTYLAQEYTNKSLRRYGYGSLYYDLNSEDPNLRIPYKEYKIELPFEQVVTTPLQDTNDLDVDLDIVYGWIVSDSRSPVQTKPWPHYSENVTPRGSFLVKDALGNPVEVTTYNAATKFLRDNGVVVQTLTFGRENDERTTSGGEGSTSDNTLFENRYKTYIQRAFNKSAKRYQFKGIVPPSKLVNLGPYTTIVLGDKSYRLDTAEVDVVSSRAILNLYSIDNAIVSTSFGLNRDNFVSDLAVDTISTNLTMGITGGIFRGVPLTIHVNALNASAPEFTLYHNGVEVESNDTGDFTVLEYRLNDTFYIRIEDRRFEIQSENITITEIIDDNRLLDNGDPITDGGDVITDDTF